MGHNRPVGDWAYNGMGLVTDAAQGFEVWGTIARSVTGPTTM
ncbi:MAG: hypothetical protein V1929_11005 [bacterium]